MNYQSVLEQIKKEVQPYFGQGKVADYIPALAKVNPTKFGMSIHTVRGEKYAIGDAKELFSIQSISKVFTLSMAMSLEHEALWKRVGREPSGSKFNSLVQLEHENGIPRNPFINAGAHVITDILTSHYENPKNEILKFVNKLTETTIHFDEEVAQSERETGNRNLAMGYFMKSFGNIHNQVRVVLDVYFNQCSLAMRCVDLSKSLLYLANDGVLPSTGERIISKKDSDRINALMLTCGMYDYVGEFAYSVGLPSKSGVGGGIVTVVPGEMVICVWAPELSESGNSFLGTKALELFVNYTGKTIF
ncbi:MAG: glutaminase [Bacteroidetes bacterium]|nr:MAG: glutaminase [Bacteroidota bacterium]